MLSFSVSHSDDNYIFLMDEEGSVVHRALRLPPALE